MKPIVIGALLIAVLFVADLAQAEVRFMVDTGHRGAVNVLGYHRQRNLLFSGGEDGMVRVWNLRTREITYALRVSHLPIVEIAVHPTLPHFAVLEGASGSYSVRVWNWERERELYNIEFSDRPLFMRYSSRGNRLIFGKLDWQSLLIVDARTGKPTSFMQDGFGIVSFAADSASEKKLMTYQPSGTITYWTIASRTHVVEPIRTVADLAAISLSANKRLMVARGGTKLLLVDAVSGMIEAQVERPGIVATAISPRGDEIACIYQEGKTRKLARYYYLSDKQLLYYIQGDEYNAIRSCAYGEDMLFLAFEDGGIRGLRPSGEVESIAEDRLARISDIAIAGDKLVVATQSTICVLSSDFFSGEVHYFSRRLLDNPLLAPVGVEFTRDGMILLWSKGRMPAAFVIADPTSGFVERSFAEFQSPLVHVAMYGDRILALDRSGLCRVIETGDFSTLFEYPAPGMNKIIYARGNTIIGGRSVISDFDSAMLWINSETGETVSIGDSRFMVYELAYDARQNLLFTVGVEKRGQEYFTVWKAHLGDDYEEEILIGRFAGEDVDASLAIDIRGRRIYSSLGLDRIQHWDGIQLGDLERSPQGPRKLAVAGGKLFSLNRDSSITVWDLASGRILLHFYLFVDFSWLTVFREAQYASSAAADRFLSIYINGRSVPLLKRYYRLEYLEPEPEPEPELLPEPGFDFNRERDYFELY